MQGEEFSEMNRQCMTSYSAAPLKNLFTYSIRCFASNIEQPQEKAKTPSKNPSTKNENLTEVDAPDSSHHGKEYGGPDGKEPTRYGDWERKGRISDF